MLSSNKIAGLVRHSNELDILDYKRELPDINDNKKLAELVKDIIAIANAVYDRGDATGYLVFGVEDKPRQPCDIRGQRCFRVKDRKHKDRKPSTNPSSSQSDLDSLNQEQLVQIGSDFIKGHRRGIVLSYDTYCHPDNVDSLVGVLEICALHGPYTLKAEIQWGDESNQGHFEIDNAWTRRGEHTVRLSPQEVIEMKDAVRERRRREKQMERRSKELATIFKEWDLKVFELVDGVPPESEWITQPLQTRLQLNRCFRKPPQLGDILAGLGEEWYLNHFIISSPPQSGRTTLLSYLLDACTQAGERSQAVTVRSWPDDPDLDELVAYFDHILDVELNTDTACTFVFDSPAASEKQLNLIELFGEAFPKSHIWATCDPNRQDQIRRRIESAFHTPPVVIDLPGYLETFPTFFEGLLCSIFDTPEPIKLFLRKKNMVFRDLAIAHEQHSRGFRITGDFRLTHAQNVNLKLSQLSMSEQVLIRVIGQLGGVSISLAQFIASAIRGPEDTFSRILESDLIRVDVTSQRREIQVSDDLPEKATMLSEPDIYYLTAILETSDMVQLGSGRWQLIEVLTQVALFVDDPSLHERLDSLQHRVQGDNYCQLCDAFFPSALQYCPNCGGNVDKESQQVSAPGSASVPFPSLTLLRRGTFDTSRGLSTRQIRHLQRTLPRPENVV